MCPNHGHGPLSLVFLLLLRLHPQSAGRRTHLVMNLNLTCPSLPPSLGRIEGVLAFSTPLREKRHNLPL